jgi:acyl-CoA synthetase
MYFIGQEKIKHEILGQNSPLRVLAFGGEACPPLSILHQWKHLKCKTRLFNLYGITEVSSWASCCCIMDKELQCSSKKIIDPNNKSVLVENGMMHLDDIEDSVALGIPLDDTIIEVRSANGSRIDEGVGCIFIGKIVIWFCRVICRVVV